MAGAVYPRVRKEGSHVLTIRTTNVTGHLGVFILDVTVQITVSILDVMVPVHPESSSNVLTISTTKVNGPLCVCILDVTVQIAVCILDETVPVRRERKKSRPCRRWTPQERTPSLSFRPVFRVQCVGLRVHGLGRRVQMGKGYERSHVLAEDASQRNANRLSFPNLRTKKVQRVGRRA